MLTFKALRRGFAAIVAAASIVIPANAETVGLVLSGGGAKGIAHIGFIQALEEEGIAIDYITGTSMGAIVGSLYAMGYSPAEMMQLLGSEEFAAWSQGQFPKGEEYEFEKPEPTSQWVDVNLNIGGDAMSDMLSTRLINPLPMSFAFMNLYASASGGCRGDFDRLMVPFRCVASDIYTHKPVVFGQGQLAEAVRASMSYPLVFQPIMVNDTLMYDGGLYDVYPINVMERAFNPDKMIGVDVSTPNTPPGLNNLMSQIENMITIGEAGAVPEDKGVNVKFDLSRFGLLGWSHAAEIYAIGYQRGKELAGTIKSRISARRSADEVNRMRREFRASCPQVLFDSVTVCDADPRKAEYIRYLFNTAASNRPLTLDDARSGFYRVASTGRLRNLVPHAVYDSVSGQYFLDLNADVSADLNLGIGGFLSSTTSSMVYARAAYDPMHLKGFSYSLEGWAGMTYAAALGRVAFTPATPQPSRIALEVEAWRHALYQSEHVFFNFDEPSFLVNSEIFARLAWSMATGGHATLEVSGGFGHQTKRYHTALPDNPNENGRARLTSDVGIGAVQWHYTTLDNPDLPTNGAEIEFIAAVQGGHRRLDSWEMPGVSSDKAYGDFSLRLLDYIPLSPKFSLGAGLDAWWSTRPLLADYTASVVNARPFHPTVMNIDLFDPAYRANQWMAVTLNPVMSLGRFQFRLAGYAYIPMRTIRPGEQPREVSYSGWFPKVRCSGEFSAGMVLPFGAVRGFVDYHDSPASRWSVGISLGMLVRAPQFAR